MSRGFEEVANQHLLGIDLAESELKFYTKTVSGIHYFDVSMSR